MLKKTVLFIVVIILASFTQSYCKDLEYQKIREESYNYLKQKYLNELPLYEKVLLPLLKDTDPMDIELHEISLDFVKILTSSSYEKFTNSEQVLYDSLNSDVDNAINSLSELRLRVIIIYMIKDTYRREYFTSILLPSLERLKFIGIVSSDTRKQIIRIRSVNEKLKKYSNQFDDIAVSLNSLVKSYTPVIKSLK